MTHPVGVAGKGLLRAAGRVLRRCIRDGPFGPAGQFTGLSSETPFHRHACCESPHGCRLALGSAFQCAAPQQEEKKGGKAMVGQADVDVLRNEPANTSSSDGLEPPVIPNRLYKYLPSQFVRAFLERGDLLFRSMSYFRQIEEEGRQDLLEGLHMDYPNHDVTLETTDGRVRWQGRAAFLNSVNPDRIFIFCLSEALEPGLFAEFDADACIEILDSHEFVVRCDRAVSQQPRFAEAGLLHGSVEYYAPGAPAKRNVKDPRCIPFFKHEAYAHQREFRLVTALQHGLQLTQRIVSETFRFDEEIANARPSHRHVIVGSLSDIAVARQSQAQSRAV